MDFDRNNVLEKIKKDNPTVYSIIKQQQKQKWELASNRPFKTVDNSSTSNDIENIKIKLSSYFK